MKEKDYDSTTSDSLLIRIVECGFCCRRRLNQRKRIYHNLHGFDVEVLDLLGTGGYGKVFRCRDLNTNRVVAIKQIYIFGIYEGVPSSIIREVSLLKELDHPNIVRLLDVLNKDHRYVNLVFEHLDCDLYQYIKDQRFPNDSRLIKSFLYQILSALAYCHSHQVIHRDVKTKNLLIDESSMMIKLADFGLAREFADPDMLYTEINVATHWYKAPEILFETGIYSSAIDMWGVGCIFGEMVIKQPIFRIFNCNDQLEAIFRMLGTPTEETWPGVTELYPDLNKKYPKFEPLDLSTIFDDLNPAGLNLLSGMLCLDPSKRITAEAALKHPYFHDLDLRSLKERN